MTDIWPRLFTDITVVCRARAVSRALSRAKFDFSAASMVLFGERVENGAEIEIINHKYCGKKCADGLTSGAALGHCHITPVLRIVIYDNIIMVQCSAPRHPARDQYDCTAITALRHLYTDEKRAQISWPRFKVLRYDVTIDGAAYRSNAPGEFIEQLFGAFMDIATEYY